MKFKELSQLSNKERKKKMKELKTELMKTKISKEGAKTRDIKKMLARLNTLERMEGGKK